MPIEDFIDSNLGDFKRPPVYPVGHYEFQVESYEFGESAKKKTPQVEFQVSAVKAFEDVAPGALDGIVLGKRKFRLTYYFTDDALFRLREFSEHCGVEPEGTIRTIVQKLVSRRFKGLLIQEASNREGSTDVFNNISRTMKLD